MGEKNPVSHCFFYLFVLTSLDHYDVLSKYNVVKSGCNRGFFFNQSFKEIRTNIDV